MAGFPYKLEPYAHQREALQATAPQKFAALLMDPGTGKTKVSIDTMAWLYRNRGLRRVVVIAPNHVHVNWTEEELPKHMTEAVPFDAFEWISKKTKSKSFQRAFAEFLKKTPSHLKILSINVDAITTAAGFKAIKSVLDDGVSMVIIDESTDIKTPGAKRTRRATAIGRRAEYRRILSGLPDPEGPLDMFSQLRFLSPHLVGSRFAEFKARYCEFEQVYVGQGKTVEKVSGYRHLDELQGIISSCSYRATKDVLNLPPKVYMPKDWFDLSPQQRRMYDELREEWRTQYESGEEVTESLGIVRQMRLQQIASGYVPTDDAERDDPVKLIPGPNPRVERLIDITRRAQPPFIIWVRFKLDAGLLCDALGKDAVRYDGDTKDSEKLPIRTAFQAGEIPYLVASPMSMSRGFTLHRARTVIYFSHYWGLEPRIQSEDRAHRAGLKHTVNYHDICGRDTIDEKIIQALRDKDDVARIVIGDQKREWI